MTDIIIQIVQTEHGVYISGSWPSKWDCVMKILWGPGGNETLSECELFVTQNNLLTCEGGKQKFKKSTLGESAVLRQ